MRTSFALATLIAVSCGSRTDLGGNDVAAGARVVTHDYKIAYEDDFVPGLTHVWHSRDSSVEPFAFETVGGFTYDGTSMAVVDGTTVDLLSSSGQVIRAQPSPGALSALDARPRPDGNRLLVAGYANQGPPKFGTLDPDGTYHELGVSTGTPSYGPDGKTVLFIDVSEQDGYELETIRDDGSKPTTLRTTTTSIDSAAFSYDGTRVVYSMRSLLALLDVASLTASVLISSDTVTFAAPSFTPDDAAIIVLEHDGNTGENDMVRLDLATRDVTTLFTMKATQLAPQPGFSVAAD